MLREAKERLAWIEAEYGEDDIDYVTFKPVCDLLEKMT